MLSNISWSSYWLWVTVIFLVYYTAIIVIFYQSQIRKTFTRLFVPGVADMQNDSDLFAVVHVLMGEIETSFHSMNQQTSKQECLQILQQHTNRYPQIKDTAFQNAVNNKLSELLYDKCSIQISEQELAAVWTDDD